MKTSDDYVKQMKEELKEINTEINTETVVNWCRKQLKKYYSERKLTELEIAKDEILYK